MLSKFKLCKNFWPNNWGSIDLWGGPLRIKVHELFFKSYMSICWNLSKLTLKGQLSIWRFFKISDKFIWCQLWEWFFGKTNWRWENVITLWTYNAFPLEIERKNYGAPNSFFKLVDSLGQLYYTLLLPLRFSIQIINMIFFKIKN